MTDTALDEERINHVDNYARSKDLVTASNGVDAVLERNVTDELAALIRLDDDERWAEHDAKIAAAKARAEAEERATEHRRRAQAFKTDEHRFPAVAVDAAIASWPNETPAMRHVRSYVESPYLILVLAGGVGAGKSSAATWAALEVGASAPAFLRASELEARGRYDKDLRTWLRTRTMLVLDDLGAEVLDGRGTFRSLLDELVDMFYGDRKRLVITTNLRKRRDRDSDEPQFVERYGDRVTSRLIQSGLWLDCGNHDLRREARPR